MTYTILGRCAKTGRVGIGIATYSITVGRYAHSAKSNAGVTVSQAFANENNNALALRLLSQGLGANAVLEKLKANDPYYTYRQIGVIDRTGAVAAYTGPGVRGWAGEVTGENYIATGNGLRGKHIGDRQGIPRQTRWRSRTSFAPGARIRPRCGWAGQRGRAPDRTLGGPAGLFDLDPPRHRPARRPARESRR